MFVSCVSLALQGKFFLSTEISDPMEYCWDDTSDEKFEVKQPDAKKQRTEE